MRLLGAWPGIMQPLQAGALKPLPPTASGPKLVENVLGKPGKLSSLGSQRRERASELGGSLISRYSYID